MTSKLKLTFLPLKNIEFLLFSRKSEVSFFKKSSRFSFSYFDLALSCKMSVQNTNYLYT